MTDLNERAIQIPRKEDCSDCGHGWGYHDTLMPLIRCMHLQDEGEGSECGCKEEPPVPRSFSPSTNWKDLGICIEYAHNHYTRLEIEHDYDTVLTGWGQREYQWVRFMNILSDAVGISRGLRSKDIKDMILQAFCDCDFDEAKRVWDECVKVRGENFVGWD